MSQHSETTPRPWRTTKNQPHVICNEGGDKWIARAIIGEKSPRFIKNADIAEANAALIVEAVNRHEALLAAVKFADGRAVSRADYDHACVEDRKLRDLIDAALGRPSHDPL